MSESARWSDDELQAPPRVRPQLEVVKGIAHTESSTRVDDEPDVVHSAMLGYIVGFLTVAVAITVAGTLGGLGFGASLGLGVFVGIWGGGGFGFMIGATVPFSRHLDAQAVARQTTPKERRDDPADP